jgi:hypothetical protein
MHVLDNPEALMAHAQASGDVSISLDSNDIVAAHAENMTEHSWSTPPLHASTLRLRR